MGDSKVEQIAIACGYRPSCLGRGIEYTRTPRLKDPHTHPPHQQSPLPPTVPNEGIAP